MTPKSRPFKLKAAFPWWKWIINPFGMWKVKKFMRFCEDIVIREFETPKVQSEYKLRLHNLRVYGHTHPEMFSNEEK